SVNGCILARRGTIKLQGTPCFLDQIGKKRRQDLLLVIIRQPPVLLGPSRLLIGDLVMSHDLVGKLAPAEKLIARIDNTPIMKNTERGRGGPDIQQGNCLPLRFAKKAKSVFQRKRLAIDD